MSKTVASPQRLPGEGPFSAEVDSDETRLSPASAWRSPTAVDARPDVGRMLNGRFVLIQQLGEGGMGRVFKALDLRKEEADDRTPYVALKLLNEDFRNHPEALRSLQREAKKAQTLAHPNVVTVHDFDRDGATLFMTMEYLPGRSLDRIVRADEFAGLPRSEAFGILRDIGAALGYAHENGIIHLDLKPANVIVADTGRAKVIDFGIARAVAQPHDIGQESTRFDAGVLNALTPTYASPEMLECGSPDPRDDIYALACIAYELLAGRHPFGRMPATEARKADIKPNKPACLSAHQWRALQRGLAFDRELRTPTVAEFVAGVTAKPWHRRNALWLATASALLAGAAVAALVFSRLPEEPIGARVPDNPSVSQVDGTAEMKARLSAAAAEAIRSAEASERVRIAATQATARTGAVDSLNKRGVTSEVQRKAVIEMAALSATLAEVEHQAAVAAHAVTAVADIEADRRSAVEKAAELVGASDEAARAAAAEEVAWHTGALNEANRLAAAEQAALTVAEDAAAQQAAIAARASRNAAEASARKVDGVATTGVEATAAAQEEGFTLDERVKIQKGLRDLGLYHGAVDGDFGPVTRDAIARFQAKNNVGATGVLTPGQASQLLQGQSPN